MKEYKNKLNAVFFDNQFKYEFDNEKYKLVLFIDKENTELSTFVDSNFKKILSLKDALVILEDKSLMWHIKECEYCFANEITFIIDYKIEIYNNTGITTIELKSMGLDMLLHPANYFYFNKESSKNDVLYDVIKMKNFKFKCENNEIKACISIGDLLKRGIHSSLINNITLSLKFESTTDIIKVCKIIDYVRKALKILSYNDDFQFNTIELKNSNNSYIGKIFEKQIVKTYKPIAKSNSLYFNNVIDKIFNNIHKIDISKLSLIKLDSNKKDYCAILVNLFSMFESNFKIRFKEYKSPTIDVEQAIIVRKCVEYLKKYQIKHENNQEQFIQSLINRIEKYNNLLFNKLSYTLTYYCKALINEEKFPMISLRLKWLYFRNLYSSNNVNSNNIGNATERLFLLRNIIVHEEELPTLEKLDEFWINAFEVIIYAMILDNLGLNITEILDHVDIFY